MIDLLHFSKKRLNIFWQYKNVEGPFYNFKYSKNFHWLCTYWPDMIWSKIVTKISAELCRSNIWWYFSRPCNVFLCGSGRCSKSDFPSNWVRQCAQRTLHGQFPGPAPPAQRPNLPSAPNSSTQHFHISDIDIGIEDMEKVGDRLTRNSYLLWRKVELNIRFHRSSLHNHVSNFVDCNLAGCGDTSTHSISHPIPSQLVILGWPIW